MLSSEHILNETRLDSNDFSFIDTFISMVNNRDFQLGSRDLIETESISKNSYIWAALSAIGQDVGDVICENVINYIDNICNIDTCKCMSLNSMIEMIGVDYSIFESLKTFPNEILKLIDILSINKKFILSNTKLRDALLTDIHLECDKQSVTTIEALELEGFTGISSIPNYITDEDYQRYVYNLINKFIVGIVDMHYNVEGDNSTSNCIWYIDRNEIVYHDTSENDNLLDTYSDFKRIHSIKSSFDPFQIVDDITNYNDFLDNYSGYEKELISMEISRRQKKLTESSLMQTRYSYYRKEKVKEYISWIENKYNSLSDINYIEQQPYGIDGNFFKLSFPSDLSINYLIDSQNLSVNYEMISDISKVITTIIGYIQKLRDLLKFQVQKNYMKGTFNLLSYVINEYLIELSKTSTLQDSSLEYIKQKLSKHKFSDIETIEYYDTTEYYNISCQTSKNAYNGKNVNIRYWEEDDIKNTNSGFAFSNSQIEDFYKSKLNMNNKVDDLERFLNTLYSLGATTSYINKSGKNVITGSSSRLSVDNKAMFLSYNGNRIGDNPFCNIKNITHSSFQLHPYLKNFIVKTEYQYPIINGFCNNTILDIEESKVLKIIDNYIGQFGETLHIAANNQFDYSGYKTHYESYPHAGQDEVPGYDGAFYTPAAYDFLYDTDNFIWQLSTQYSADKNQQTYFEKYYKHLNLTNEQYVKIAQQLYIYQNDIKDIIGNKPQLSDVYDIFKYGKDKYENIFILYKKYSSNEPSYTEKMNTTGELWIRLKDHPIALPAIWGEKPQIETSNFFNDEFSFLAQIKDGRHNMILDENHMRYIYDIEFDETHSGVIMVVDPLNDHGLSQSRHSDKITENYYRAYEQGELIASKIWYEYDEKEYCYKLYLKGDEIAENYIPRNNSYNQNDVDDEMIITGSSLIGIRRMDDYIYSFYIDKALNKATNTYSIYKDNLKISYRMWKLTNKTKFFDDIKLDQTIIPDTFEISRADVRMNYYNDIVSLLFIVHQINEGSNIIQNYCGIHTDSGYTDYYSNTQEPSDESEYNSFDRIEEYPLIVDIHVLNSQQRVESGYLYNLHIDPSYIPSYPYLSGYIDTTKTVYGSNRTNQIELLGESKNIDDFIARVDTSADIYDFLDLEKFREKYQRGRVFEDYDFRNNDKMCKLFRYSQIEDSHSRSGTLTWDISMGDYTEAELSQLQIIMFNVDTYSKNPYLVCELSDIETTDGNFISLKNDKKTYQSESDIIEHKKDYIGVVGTLNYYKGKTTLTDNNHLNNVDDILIRFNRQLKKITILFIAEDNEKEYFIKDKQIALFLYNVKSLLYFENFHFFDAYGIISDGMFSDGTYLSDINFEDYDSLSDIPPLSGYYGMSFKYSEEDTFGKDEPYLFYYPGLNLNYPLKGIEIMAALYEPQQKSYEYLLSNIYSEKNLFIIKYEDEKTFERIGNIEIGVVEKYEDYNIRAYSDYNDNRHTYDTVDPKVLQYVKILTDKNYISGEIIEVDDPFDYQRIEEYIETKLEPRQTYPCYISKNNTSDYNRYVNYTTKLSDFVDISDIFNIYANYKYENGGITLYFNYYNYLNSPFVKFDENDKHKKIAYLDGSYLKLEPNQDGVLDIYCQIKYYADNDKTLYGVQNVKMCSYRIYNISDDKPKFIINKIYEIEPNTIKVKRPSNYINIQLESKHIEITAETDAEFKQQVEFTVSLDYNYLEKPKSLYYDILYATESVEHKDGSEWRNDGIISISEPVGTDDQFHRKTFTFRTKKTKKEIMAEYKDVFRINFIIDPHWAKDDNDNDINIGVIDGVVDIRDQLVLRQESTNTQDFILTEANQGSKFIKT